MDLSQDSYDEEVALFFDHLLGDVLGLSQDSPPIIALREVGYDNAHMFLGLSLEKYWNELVYTETTHDGWYRSWSCTPYISNYWGHFGHGVLKLVPDHSPHTQIY